MTFLGNISSFVCFLMSTIFRSLPKIFTFDFFRKNHGFFLTTEPTLDVSWSLTDPWSMTSDLGPSSPGYCPLQGDLRSTSVLVLVRGSLQPAVHSHHPSTPLLYGERRVGTRGLPRCSWLGLSTGPPFRGTTRVDISSRDPGHCRFPPTSDRATFPSRVCHQSCTTKY